MPIIAPIFKYLSAGLAVLCVVLYILLQAEKAHSAKVAKRAEYYRSELNRISTAKDTQKTVTKERIVVVEKSRRVADKVAKQVEAAPLPGNCATPDLDTLRNEI